MELCCSTTFGYCTVVADMDFGIVVRVFGIVQFLVWNFDRTHQVMEGALSPYYRLK